MSFSILPTEILELVLFQIEDRKTLRSFVLTCKQFHEVAHTKITCRQFEGFVGASSVMEARYPWQFLMASHKAHQIADWAFSDFPASKEGRAEQVYDETFFGSERLAKFAVDKLGLTYVDVILERAFYRTLYAPLRDHIDFLVKNGPESFLRSRSLDKTILNLALFIDMLHYHFTPSLQVAMNDSNLKSTMARRRSLGQPQHWDFGEHFLRMGTIYHEEPYCSYEAFQQVNRLTKFLAKNLKGVPWRTWVKNDNGADIAPHVYGLAGILSLFEGSSDHLPSPTVINAISKAAAR